MLLNVTITIREYNVTQCYSHILACLLLIPVVFDGVLGFVLEKDSEWQRDVQDCVRIAWGRRCQSFAKSLGRSIRKWKSSRIPCMSRSKYRRITFDSESVHELSRAFPCFPGHWYQNFHLDSRYLLRGFAQGSDPRQNMFGNLNRVP